MKSGIKSLLAGAAFCVASVSASASCALVHNQMVSDTVTAIGGGQYSYGYAISGLVQMSCIEPGDIYSFSIPYFADAGITNIVSPTGWSYSIGSTDYFGLGHGAGTLTWSTTPGSGIPASLLIDQIYDPGMGGWVNVWSPLVELSGFGYLAMYDAAEAPYSGKAQYFYNGQHQTIDLYGDPAIPASPDALASGLLPIGSGGGDPSSNVPEPGSLVLIAMGLLVAFASGFRSSRRRGVLAVSR